MAIDLKDVREDKVPFVHLHLHTEYSLLDGCTRLKVGKENSPLIMQCLKMGMRGVAVTDHGNMMGSFTQYELEGKYNKALKAYYKENFDRDITEEEKFHMLFGCEFYTCDDMRARDDINNRYKNHLILLAKSQKGINNLIKLTSNSYLDGFYQRPSIDLNELEKHSEGLVCLSACIQGRIPRLLLANDYEGAKEYALKLKSFFDEGDFYIEIQDHGIDEEKIVLPQLVKLAKDIGVKVVATNDVHYLTRDDADAQDVLMCISTGATLNDEKRLKHDQNELYLKSYEEMMELFKWIPEAVTNTVEVYEKCKGLVFKEHQEAKLYPAYIPDNGMTAEEYLRDLTFKGLKRRYKDKLSQVQIDRANTELNVIHTKGFDSYYLVVWDFINYARSVDIPIGPGRGSGVGSIVAYAIGITNVEPLQFDLLFERFLNPERSSPPDFDIDICTERRGEVIDYVVKKYGRDRVCQILTLGTLKPKNAIRDVGRVYDIPLDLVNKTLKTLPNDPKLTIDGALGLTKDKDGNPIPGMQEFIDIYNQEPSIKEVVDMARRLEGWPRNCSMHAAGVVICNTVITDEVPLQLRKVKDKDVIFTQFQKGELEAMGVLKMDFLGLITLTDIHKSIKYAKEEYGIDVDFDEIGYADKNVYEMISQGDTDLVFQLDSGGMRKFMKDLHPNNIEDLILGISMYRPGPMGDIDDYLKARNNPEMVNCYHPCLEPILKSTYGFFVYQEQVMNAARSMSTYSLGEADILRRCMGKKDAKAMEEQKVKFLKGAKEKGIDENLASEVFAIMQRFAQYAFNKSHAAAYAAVAYQTAYMKYYYYVELLCAILNNRITKTDKLIKYLNIAKETNVAIFPPDVNKSRSRFRVENKGLRFGLTAIKNIGEGVADEIVNERETNGEYKSLEDFIKRLGPKVVNKSTLENLIKAGAMDVFGYSRATLMGNYSSIMKRVASDTQNACSGQFNMFDMIDEDIPQELEIFEEYDHLELLAMEKEVLNLYMSGHPLEHYTQALKTMQFNLSYIQDLLNVPENDEEDEEQEEQTEEDQEAYLAKKALIEEYNGKQIHMGGILDQFVKKKTKDNKIIGSAKLTDNYATVNILFFPKVYEKYKDVLINDYVVEIDGRIMIKDEIVTIAVQKIFLMKRDTQQKNIQNNETNKKESQTVYVLGDAFANLISVKNELDAVLYNRHNGHDSLFIQYDKKLYKYSDDLDFGDSDTMRIYDLFGLNKVKIVKNN